MLAVQFQKLNRCDLWWIFLEALLKKSIFSPFARKVLSHIHDYLGKHIPIISLLLLKVSPHNDNSIPYIKSVDFFGNSLENVDFFPICKENTSPYP
jgi:hypothetical protein